ncbi:HNH endonuclease [Luteibacter aegosomatissinici]|uniref:HNH endonuclease n=1 Tax=Luteibacter aegosomatissinici TaxID=2911539 RepID=UPI001FFB1837|nr:HNH endonuclease [Luteibacter aegosomatissinici]UPG94485.1 HNH endonuclease [Luteibacter aegosomatissinici]
MKWIKIAKEPGQFPTKGTYKDWKEPLRTEGQNQCVYCAIHESKFGGLRNYHVEHFRPKSIYKERENDYCNLFYACSICNTFKSDDWPHADDDDGDDSKRGDLYVYPSPIVFDYNAIMTVDNNGFVNGGQASARYLIERLYLNRPQLIRARVYARVSTDISCLVDEIRALVKEPGVDPQFALRAVDAIGDAFQVTKAGAEAVPYEPIDVKRPKKGRA